MAQQRFRIASYLDPNPPNGKTVTQPSRWVNPFRIRHEAADAAEAVAMFREHLQQQPVLVELGSRGLRVFDLGCTCPLDRRAKQMCGSS